MKLSIVVPVLDEAATIAASLDALVPLRRSGHEVIVVDGGSADDTPAIVRGRVDRVLFAPRGRAVQMNVGASVARGEVLVFLHADCRLPDEAAEAIAQAQAQGARWGRFDLRLDGRSRWLPVVAAMMNARSALTGICTGDQALFVDRATFAALGGFPPLPLMEDVAITARLRREAGRPARVRRRVTASGRRWDRDGAWGTILSMWSLRLAYWRGASPDDLVRRYYGRPASPRPVLQVFAKAPLPGRVKTRLARSVGDEAAAAAYRWLAERTLATAGRARRAGVVESVELWVEPGAPPAAFDAWLLQGGATLHEQQGADLGARMRHALRTALARGRAGLLIGTDVPGYDVPYLAHAAASLATHDAVLGPAEDGGYVLVGLARDIDAFSGVAWSTADVLAQTRQRLDDAGARRSELAPLWDVDSADDWERCQREGCAA